MKMELENKDWKETDLNVDSLWLIPERGKYGKHKNIYHGNFIPQIPNQLIRRYTKIGETVLELFSGSGTTLYECEELKRDYIGFDINTDIIDYVNSNMNNSSMINWRNSSHNCGSCDTLSRRKSSGYCIAFSICLLVSLLISINDYLYKISARRVKMQVLIAIFRIGS